MRLNFDLEDYEPREMLDRFVFKRLKEDLELGISQSRTGVAPYVCAYWFIDGPKVLTDIEQAPVKMSLRSMLKQEIEDLAGDIPDAGEEYKKHLVDSLEALRGELDRASRKIGKALR